MKSHWGMARRLIWLLGLLPALALAGPPFVTDDPEPVDYQHWEVYLASQTAHGPDGSSGTLPHVEVNYGLVPNLQVHVIAPEAFASGGPDGRAYGYGDTELGAKYRLAEETGSRPEIALFPLVELPTGNASRGLGTGHTHVFLPVWLQKSFGSWIAYGGGGYWINPGPGNRNYGFAGLVLQKQVTKTLAIGAEIFHQTAQTRSGGPDSQVNAGFTWDLTDNDHVLASAGPSIQGPSGYETYAAFQLTFGPKK
jgi:hypothetical protein